VAGLDRTGNNLRKEWLVGQVWQWVDEGNLGLTLAEKLL
jgi:hypothetical protein